MNAFDQQRARSKRIEMAVAKYLGKRGWFVLATYDFSGAEDEKAPKLHTAVPSEALIVPDLLGFRAGKRFWWEVKLKTESTFYRRKQRAETGCDLRHWLHYEKVQRESGTAVWLVFVHERQDEILAATLDMLKAAQPRKSQVGGKWLVYFPCAAMKRLGTVSEVLGADAAMRRAA